MKSFVLWCASIAVAIIMVVVAVPKATTAFAAAGDLTGQAWSANVGWIHFGNAGAPYGVKLAMSGTSRPLSGYAWSSNIGWVSFNSDATAGCPSGTCQARVEWGASGGPSVLVKGWARACSVFVSGCSGGLKAGGKDGATLGGWDGWISLGNGASTVPYGVKLNTGTGEASGRGWGSEVVGWVDFTGVKLDVTTTVPTEICGNGIDDDGVGGDAPCPPTGPFCPDGTTPLPSGGPNNCPGGPGSGTEICGNGIDEDGNGSDLPCPPGPNVEICGNTLDDDGDGSINEGCDEGPAALCTNISNATLANMTPPILTTADLLANHYRVLSDGRCVCAAGYFLNAQFQCVKPVYQEE